MSTRDLELLVEGATPALTIWAWPLEEAAVDQGRGDHTPVGRRRVLAGRQTPFPPLREGRLFPLARAAAGAEASASAAHARQRRGG